MVINFDKLSELSISNLNGGEGIISSRMFIDNKNKIMISKLPVGSSIGEHRHEISSEVNYVISGNGKVICDGKEENLELGTCHYCPKNSTHSIINNSDQDLILLTIVSK